MPAEYRIDLAKRVVLCRAWGVLTDQDLADYQAAVSVDPQFQPDLAQLYDGTAITKLRITAMALLSLTRQSRFRPDARRAFVVSSDVAYGMARMYSMLSGHEGTIQVFRDQASAMRWLDASSV